jgi:hypothetical protein
LRAFVFPKGFDIGVNLDNGPSGQSVIVNYFVSVTFENVGLTPALEMQAFLGTKIFPMNEDREPSFQKDNRLAPNGVLGPRTITRTGMLAIELETMMQHWRNETEIFVWFRVEYKDVFNPTKVHHSQLCCRIEQMREPNIFIPNQKDSAVRFTGYGPLNSAD